MGCVIFQMNRTAVVVHRFLCKTDDLALREEVRSEKHVHPQNNEKIQFRKKNLLGGMNESNAM